jgi:hypothetical protein
MASSPPVLPHRPVRRGPRGRRWWQRRPRLARVVALAAVPVLGGLLLTALVLHEALALRRDLVQAQHEFDRALAVTEPLLSDFGSFRDTDTALRDAAAHLAAADAALARAQTRADRLAPVFAVGARLPGWPGGLGEVAPLITAARSMAAAGIALSDAFSRTAARLEATDREEPAGARMAAALTAGEPGFRQALAHLDRALAVRAAVRAERLTGPLAPGARALATLDRRYGTVRDNLILLGELPATARVVLGMEGPRTYAVLGQNSAELRPTGGFIGSLGLITVDGGAIAREDYRSAYNFDNPSRGFPPLPAPMADHLGPGGMAVRDANWSPDFPTTARTVADILGRHQDVRLDGVIGFTTATVGALLEAMGPLAVEGFDAPVTAATWYDLAERLIYFTEAPGPGVNTDQTKGEVLAPILRAVLARVQRASADELPAILRALQRAVAERQLLLFFRDPAPATLARRYDADGRLAPPRGDVLAVVDANLSYSKVGPYIDQRIEYDVWLNARGVAEKSRLTVTYTNRVTPALARDPTKRIGGVERDQTTGRFYANPGVYGTYARVYLPRNSRILDIGGLDPPPAMDRDLGFTTIERYYSVPAAGQVSFAYTYQIPTDLNPPGTYRLTVRKQPGTTGPELIVRVHLPPGATAAANRSLERAGDTLLYRGALTTDFELHLTLAGGVP